jgi:hypothetical protein
MTALQRLRDLIWGFPSVRDLTGSLSFIKKGGGARSRKAEMRAASNGARIRRLPSEALIASAVDPKGAASSSRGAAQRRRGDPGAIRHRLWGRGRSPAMSIWRRRTRPENVRRDRRVEHPHASLTRHEAPLTRIAGLRPPRADLPRNARRQLTYAVHEGGENAFGLADDFDLRQAVEDFLP